MPRKPHATWRLMAGLLLMGTAGWASAETATGHDEHEAMADHRPLPTSDDLTLAELVERTYARHFGRGVLQAGMSHAEAWSSRGSALTGGGPALSLRYQTDRLQQNEGLREYEAGLSLPLWRWGERSNAQALAGAIAAAVDSGGEALRWTIAGELRQLLWALAMAHSRHRLATANLEDSIALRDAIARQVSLGEIPRGDLLLAEMELTATREAMLTAEAEVVDLAHAFIVLTGQELRPQDVGEKPAEKPAAEHPLIAQANAALDRARREAQAETYQAMGAPTVLIGSRWERGNGEAPYEDSLGVTVTVPLGGSQRRVRESAGAVAVAQAQQELDRRLREQQLALHEARHNLQVARRSAEQRRERATLATRRGDMMAKAFGAGEVDLLEYTRARAAARDAVQAAEEAALQVQLAIALHNQALGVLP